MVAEDKRRKAKALKNYLRKTSYQHIFTLEFVENTKEIVIVKLEDQGPNVEIDCDRTMIVIIP